MWMVSRHIHKKQNNESHPSHRFQYGIKMAASTNRHFPTMLYIVVKQSFFYQKNKQKKYSIFKGCTCRERLAAMWQS